ncbi:DNA-processing protein DprA [Virgibacillus oceani]
MRLIHLSRCQGMSRKRLRKVIHQDPSLKKIYSFSPQTITNTLSIPMKTALSIYNDLRNQQLIQSVMEDTKKYTIITLMDEYYPPQLKVIKDPPIVLYMLGDTSLLTHSPSLSVIGTRKPSKEAMEKTKYVIQPLADTDWVIVSGMASGIDSYAHQISLLREGKTIAVLGGGFHHIYPTDNTLLFQEIVKNGLAMSEYPPSLPPKRHHFPERNRIISGLSFGTLVIEATKKSGTLITVDQALDQGREVYAVPGSPLIPQTIGCNDMIQEGAKLVQHASDIVEDWEAGGVYFRQIHVN